MGLLNYFMMGNIAGGQTIVIDVNGNVRILLEGEQPLPGEVVINADGTQSTAPTSVQVRLVDALGVPQDITAEVEDIFAALEGGVDPTQLGEDFATAAGGQGGSSPTGTGTIERDGSATLASTNFETDGFTSIGLSETQSLTLSDLEAQFPPFFTESINGAPLGDNLNVETDEDIPISGQLTASDPNDDPLTFELVSGVSNGELVLNSDGSWTYTPGDDFNGQDQFTAIVDDGNGGQDTLVVNIDVLPVDDPSDIYLGEGDDDSGSVTEDVDTNLDVEGVQLEVTGTLSVQDVDGDGAFNTTPTFLS
ncbi:hypothetical protein TW81_17890, partial [Vibrio galatheae]